MKTIAAIGAHHDDVEIGAGGTLARYIEQGHHVLYVVATTTPHYESSSLDDSGKVLTNTEVINMRKNEARSGAEILGVKADDVFFFDFKSQYWYEEGSRVRRYLDGHDQDEGEFAYLNEKVPGNEFILNAMLCNSSLNKVMAFLDENDVDIVLTHFPDDPHNEHYAVAALVHGAAISLQAWGKKIEVFAWDEGDARHMLNSFGPTHVIDISSTIQKKIDSLRVFKSQFKDRNPQPFVDYSLNRARFYGKLIGVAYAEAFMKYRDGPYSHVDLKLPFGYSPVNVKRQFI
ncbi:MAG: PIG-L deacetylase family protein [Promethearchaeota archaeon]